QRTFSRSGLQRACVGSLQRQDGANHADNRSPYSRGPLTGRRKESSMYLRGFAVVLLGLAAAACVAGQETRKDLYAEALPAGALARLGSYRFQLAGKCVAAATFSPD